MYCVARIEDGVRRGQTYPEQGNKRGRSQWTRGLKRWSAAAHLLGLSVRIPAAAWMSVSCECCVLSGTDLCGGLIIRPEESLPSVMCLSVIVKPR